MSLQFKMMLFISAVILLSAGIATSLYVRDFKASYLEAIEWRSVSLAQSVSVELTNNYKYFKDVADPTLLIESAYLQCKKLYRANSDMHVEFVAVLNLEGGIVTHSDKTFWGRRLTSPDLLAALQEKRINTVLVGQDYHTLIPVVDGEKKQIATIDVGFPLEIVEEKVGSIIRKAVMLYLIFFLCLFLLVWLFVKYLVCGPVDRIVRFTSAIADGEYETDVYLDQTREFKNLSLGLAHLRDSIKQNLQEITEKNQQVAAMVRCSPVALFSIDLEGVVTIWTTSAEKMFGWQAAEVLGGRLPFLPDKQGGSLDTCLKAVELQGIPKEMEVECRQKDGSLISGSISLAPIQDLEGRPTGIMGTVQDISERVEREKEHREIQEQLVQAQKMESVGRLAGGVAHDYNNMLGVILGYADMLKTGIAENDKKYQYIDQIIQAAKRSAEITGQLLTFARKQTINPKKININDCIEQMYTLLMRLLGEDITLNWIPQNNLPLVLMDSTQMDQILANLCINARDAMEHGGEISIETRAASIEREFFGTEIGFKSGEFVCLSVSDNGVGMSKEIQDKIFEPFFTTKKQGKGTGLGLATIYGIIKQNNGFIHVYSEPGQGSTFNIYLPMCEGVRDDLEVPAEAAGNQGNRELVLVVEDEPTILVMCEIMLENLNYRVVKAQNPESALEIAETEKNDLKLLITDVILPGMNGRELAKALQNTVPALKVLYMSGYTANVIARHGVLEQNIHFIQKPFSKEDLGKKVRKALQV